MSQPKDSDSLDIAAAVEELQRPLAEHLQKYSLKSLVGRDWISIEQFASVTGLSIYKVKMLIDSQRLSAVKVGNQYRIYEDMLYSYLRSCIGC